MHLTRLRLQHFRSWPDLDLQLQPGLTIVSGANASGKTNLIEAAAMLAALRSPRASREGELIAWSAEPPAVARIEGEAQTAQSSVRVEIALAARSGANADSAAAPPTQKRIRVDGLPRSASQALGAIRAVAFSGLDADLLTGEAARRRTFLDLTISQVHGAHAVALSRYRQAVQQRNALLRRIAARQAAPAELTEWDELLAAEAGRIWQARAAAADYLVEQAQTRHAQLHGADAAGERLALRYEPALGEVSPAIAERDSEHERREWREVSSAVAERESEHESEREWRERMLNALERARPDDLRRAVTTVGPHRDDLAITLNGRSAAAYGSRAQQRDAALALRAAQADLIAQRSGEAPILLLDDLFSELDANRRERAAQFLHNAAQVILTTARPETLPASLPTPAAQWRIQSGRLSAS